MSIDFSIETFKYLLGLALNNVIYTIYKLLEVFHDLRENIIIFSYVHEYVLMFNLSDQAPHVINFKITSFFLFCQ